MDRWAPRGPSRRFDDDPYRRSRSEVDEQDYAYSRPRGRDVSDDDERRRPVYAEREDHRFRSGDYRSYQDHDSRQYDDYHDSRSSRYSRESHHTQRDREFSPLRYSDETLFDQRSSSPDPSRRTSSTDLGNAPSNELKLSGLPKDEAYAISEDTIKHQIESLSKAALSSVRVITDRVTGKPKGFGFATFQDVDDAVKFYEKYKAGFVLYGDDSSEKYNVDVAYAINKARDPRNQVDPEWICQLCGMQNRATRAVCFRGSCKASRDISRPSGYYSSTSSNANYNHNQVGGNASAFGRPGESDRSPDGQPSHFLLVLGLSLNTTTTILAKGIAKLYSEDEDGLDLVQTANHAKNQRNNASRSAVGARKSSIRRVFLIKDRRSGEPRRYGFVEFHTVDDAVAALNKFNSEDRFTIASYEVDVAHPHNGIFKPALGGPSSYTVELAIPGQPMEYWESSCYAVEEWINKDAPSTEGKAGSPPPAKDTNDGNKLSALAKKPSKKRKAESIESSNNSTPAMASLFGTWNKAKEQLNDGVHTKSVTQSFLQVHEDGVNCLLCGTKLKSLEIAQKHEAESTSHKAKLLDSEAVKKGLDRLFKRGIIDKIPDVTDGISGTSTEPYFDRAKQRRLEIKQTEKPPQKISFSLGPKKDSAKDSEAPVVSQTKGLDMMRKMGYSGSGGLGAEGAGSAEMLPVSMYAAGVGLGAEGGKMGDAVEEAGRNTRNDRDEYLEKMREKVKERFHNLQART